MFVNSPKTRQNSVDLRKPFRVGSLGFRVLCRLASIQVGDEVDPGVLKGLRHLVGGLARKSGARSGGSGSGGISKRVREDSNL